MISGCLTEFGASLTVSIGCMAHSEAHSSVGFVTKRLSLCYRRIVGGMKVMARRYWSLIIGHQMEFHRASAFRLRFVGVSEW